MNRTPEQWAQVKPDAFLDGSIVQARNVIEMMQQDIAALVKPFKYADRKDWQHLDLLLGHSAHGKYWRDILEDFRARAALQSKEVA